MATSAEKWRVYRTDRRARIRGLVNEIKLAKGCADCGFNFHAAALGFDHTDPNTKARDIGRMVSIGAGMESIEREIDKCDVVCHNCHAIREHERRQS